jgi:hypothetical protein
MTSNPEDPTKAFLRLPPAAARSSLDIVDDDEEDDDLSSNIGDDDDVDEELSDADLGEPLNESKHDRRTLADADSIAQMEKARTASITPPADSKPASQPAPPSAPAPESKPPPTSRSRSAQAAPKSAPKLGELPPPSLPPQIQYTEDELILARLLSQARIDKQTTQTLDEYLRGAIINEENLTADLLNGMVKRLEPILTKLHDTELKAIIASIQAVRTETAQHQAELLTAQAERDRILARIQAVLAEAAAANANLDIENRAAAAQHHDKERILTEHRSETQRIDTAIEDERRQIREEGIAEGRNSARAGNTGRMLGAVLATFLLTALVVYFIMKPSTKEVATTTVATADAAVAQPLAVAKTETPPPLPDEKALWARMSISTKNANPGGDPGEFAVDITFPNQTTPLKKTCIRPWKAKLSDTVYQYDCKDRP